MIVTTTHNIEGQPIKHYYGIVTGEVIIGANAFKDLFASIRDFIGGRSGSYESVLAKARTTAMKEMVENASSLGANAVVAVDFDYETMGARSSMIMVSCTGTAVSI